MPTASTTHHADHAAVLRSRVVAHDQVAEATFRIRVDCPPLAARALPGQFAMLRLADRCDPLLARPLAVYDVFSDGIESRYADFLYVVHGKFTRALADVRPGDELLVWGPLGNGFALPSAGHLLLVAGGIGQTALLALARERLGRARYGLPARTADPATRVTFCWGARTAAAFACTDDFRKAGCDVHLATLDGSTGTRGTVVDLLEERFAGGIAAADTRVACCGPEPMMEAVAAWAAGRGIPCAVSLETPMACGIGICFTCVARIRDADGGWDYRRTCVEGPVFDATRVVW
ncbi:MAG: dihydroorotate dehydrogenase electron transfer subunit [Planctomycetota bacterium]